MQNWAYNSKPQNYKDFNIKGIGLATFQYLRMLLGVSTVKPDVHISNTVQKALGYTPPKTKIIDFFVTASNIMGINPLILDHSVWKYYSSQVNKGNNVAESLLH